MQRTTRLPADAQLVLPARTREAVREHTSPVAIFVVTVVIAGFGVGATGSPVWTVIGVLCLAGVVLELLLVRAQIGFGPVLAADREHVWVRAGGFLSPRSVQLDWSEITTVTLHVWRGRRDATARYLSFDLADDAAAQLAADPKLARRVRRLTRVFGSPLAISEQRAHVLDGTLRNLRDLAPDGVGFVNKA
ncbi:hypothetical protein [Actinophytocola sp.]|uniref:hypothetical protein n=1 Tax=Actinophytocola sp. TaxID=1872138 RepID=UPI002ED4835D